LYAGSVLEGLGLGLCGQVGHLRARVFVKKGSFDSDEGCSPRPSSG
jgi:hypothetical protein